MHHPAYSAHLATTPLPTVELQSGKDQVIHSPVSKGRMISNSQSLGFGSAGEMSSLATATMPAVATTSSSNPGGNVEEVIDLTDDSKDMLDQFFPTASKQGSPASMKRPSDERLMSMRPAKRQHTISYLPPTLPAPAPSPSSSSPSMLQQPKLSNHLTKNVESVDLTDITPGEEALLRAEAKLAHQNRLLQNPANKIVCYGCMNATIVPPFNKLVYDDECGSERELRVIINPPPDYGSQWDVYTQTGKKVRSSVLGAYLVLRIEVVQGNNIDETLTLVAWRSEYD